MDAELDRIFENVAYFWAQGSIKEAFDQIELLVKIGTPEVVAQAFLLNGIIKMQQGNSADARSDWQKGIECARKGTFLLYSLQCELGKSYQKEDENTKALKWYQSAIRTCAQGEDFSCNEALYALLSLLQDTNAIDDDDKVAISIAIVKTWEILQLQGNPDLTNIVESIVTLNHEFMTIYDKTRSDN